MKDNNHRFKINTVNYRPSNGGSISYLVGEYRGTHNPTRLVASLSSRRHNLVHLGASKSFNVRMFALNELKLSADTLDELIHTLRNEELTYMSLGSSDMLSTNINKRINEKFIMEEIDDGVI